MRKQNDEITEQAVATFYKNISRLVAERHIKVKDLSMAIGLGPRTLSSMKSQNQNPGLMTVKKIAKILDVSIDELIDDNPEANREINDLIWFLHSIKDNENASVIAQQLLSIGQTLSQSCVKEATSRYEASESITHSLINQIVYVDKDESEKPESETVRYDEDK